MARSDLILTVVSMAAFIVLVSLTISFSTSTACLECDHLLEEMRPKLEDRISRQIRDQRSEKMADKNFQVLEQQSVSIETKIPSPDVYMEKKVEVKKIVIKRSVIQALPPVCEKGQDLNHDKCKARFPSSDK